jgi:hypothetical protein
MVASKTWVYNRKDPLHNLFLGPGLAVNLGVQCESLENNTLGGCGAKSGSVVQSSGMNMFADTPSLSYILCLSGGVRSGCRNVDRAFYHCCLEVCLVCQCLLDALVLDVQLGECTGGGMTAMTMLKNA